VKIIRLKENKLNKNFNHGFYQFPSVSPEKSVTTVFVLNYLAVTYQLQRLNRLFIRSFFHVISDADVM